MRKNTSVIHVKILAFLTKLKLMPHLVLMVAMLNSAMPATPIGTYAASCPDVKVIFARGSGGERYTSKEYNALVEALGAKLRTTELTYEFDDLDYPAVSIDATDGHLGTLLGAYFGGGKSYEFGDSVKKGVQELASMVNSGVCKNTKYVLAGYSQGAVVVDYGLDAINPDKIIYAATFGDPKIYLPEGAGMVPIACKGENLSEYRMYVPDCRAHKGILGPKIPYRLDSYQGKVGTWCNKMDILCSSHYSTQDHMAYVEAGLYEDASRFIFSKIAAEFNFTNEYTSPHDTAILIDSTRSMRGLISKYKAEALKLAKKTLETGGRVALYDYRDLKDPYEPVEGCNFETCTLESSKMALDAIVVEGGGDDPESLLSASFHVMKSLNWNFGSTKSLVILTDDTYHSPDRDGVTFYDVKTLSKLIDPVNFYIITTPGNVTEYEALAEATDGAVVSTVDDLSVLTDTIIARFDSLPHVEEDESDELVSGPHLEITNVGYPVANSVEVEFTTDGVKTMVILNDMILGVTDEKSIMISDLKAGIQNTLTLVPLSEDMRGEPAMIQLEVQPGKEVPSEEMPDEGTSEDEAVSEGDLNEETFDEEVVIEETINEISDGGIIGEEAVIEGSDTNEEIPKQSQDESEDVSKGSVGQSGTESSSKIDSNTVGSGTEDYGYGMEEPSTVELVSTGMFIVPKAPNTGRR